MKFVVYIEELKLYNQCVFSTFSPFILAKYSQIKEKKRDSVTLGQADGVLLTDYMPRGVAVNGSHYASLIERLCSLIHKKRRSKSSRGVLLLHDNAPIHKCSVVQAAIRHADFVELNHPSYSPDIAPSDYHLFSNLKGSLRGQTFSSDDEVISNVEDYLNDLDSDFFCKGIHSLRDRWQRVVASEGHCNQ